MSHARDKADKLPTRARTGSSSRSAPAPVAAAADGAAALALPEPLARAVPPADGRRRTASHKFDKAFHVLLSSDRGLVNGVGRNISPEGMFIETRDVCPIGSELRVLFSADSIGTELTAVAEVRFQCFLNFAGSDGESDGVRGVGVRFLRFEEPLSSSARLRPVTQ